MKDPDIFGTVYNKIKYAVVVILKPKVSLRIGDIKVPKYPHITATKYAKICIEMMC